ncbi:MAG: hypothetical protein HRT45_11440 [Bdellovibrionales bacterium]|nr:hypothetical protein [Bdellovibrionales bacterium]
MKSGLVLILLSIFMVGCNELSSSGFVSAIGEKNESADNGSSGVDLDVPVMPEEPIAEPDPKPEPVFEFDRDIANKMDWHSQHPSSDEWTLLMLESLEEFGQLLIDKRPQDITRFCPEYDSLNAKGRVWFWVYLFSVMARYESAFDPETFFREPFNDRFGNRVESRGLLQISVESGRGYRCDIPQEEDLHDPAVNLECGVRIMERWIGRDSVLSGQQGSSWRGGARYWAVLRGGSRNLVEKILAKTTVFELCK